MRRLTTSLLLTSILLFATAESYAAAPSAGEKCIKAGQSQISNGKKFTCIKSGKKLVWNKGVLIKAVPTPKPSPVPSVTSSPTPAPTQQPTPAPTPVAEWQATQFKIVAELKSLTPAKVQKLNFVLSPTANVVNAKKLSDSYQEPITLLSNLFVNPGTVTFLVMSEKDREWWIQQLKILNSAQDLDWWNGSHCKVADTVHCGYGSIPETDGSFHFGQLLGSKFSWKTHDYVIAYHESIHVYQLGLMGTRMRDLPYWFAEGQANYLGMAFVHNFQNSAEIRDGQLRDLLNRLPELKKYSSADWVKFVSKIDTDSEYTFNNMLGYSIGALLLEDLYNKYSYQQIHQWLVEIKAGSNYSDSFKKVFGADYQTWLTQDGAKYLDSQI